MLKPGKNIRLVPYEPEQWEHIYRWYYSGEYEEFFRDVQNTPTSDFFKSYVQWRNAIVFLILKCERVIGMVMIHDIKAVTQSAHIGVLIEKEFEGQKVGCEASYLIIKHLFEDLNLRKLCIETLSRNSKLARYMGKCGIEKEGILKGEAKISGKFEDVTRWAMFEPHARQFIDHMERK